MMIKKTVYFVLIVLLAGFSGMPKGWTSSATDAVDVPDASEMIRKVQESVVDIQTTGQYRLRTWRPDFMEIFYAELLEKNLLYEKKFKYKSEGAGVAIDASGFILTNAHVVSLFDEIQVRTHDNKILKAVLISKDVEHDLALIQVQAPYVFKPLPFAEIDQIKIAAAVYAIGNPLSYRQTVTQGIISALNRQVDLDPHHPMRNMIQTTADVNPGNSGGPLVNQQGQMVGIITMSDPRARGINFAVSLETINAVLPKLKTPPKETEGYKAFMTRYGFSLEEKKNETGKNDLMITDISTASKAYKAGLRENDILRVFQKTPTTDLTDLLKEVKNIKPNTAVYVQIERNQKHFFTYLGAQ